MWFFKSSTISSSDNDHDDNNTKSNNGFLSWFFGTSTSSLKRRKKKSSTSRSNDNDKITRSLSFPAPRTSISSSSSSSNGGFFMTQDIQINTNTNVSDDDFYDKQHTPVKRDSSKIDRHSPNSPSPRYKYGRSTTLDDIFDNSRNSRDYDDDDTMPRKPYGLRKSVTNTKVITTKSPNQNYCNSYSDNSNNNISYNTRSNSKLNNQACEEDGNGKQKKLCCDKCDGKHDTSQCPYFKKDREDHPDAQKNAYKKIGGVSNLPGSIYYNARLVRQPGDGSCLFHSMSYGLRDGSNASKLRAELCNFIANNPDCKISDTPLSDWIKWDSSINCSQYARKMSGNSWGGGIEMAITSHIKKCNVHVYEKNMFGYKRISAFDYAEEPEKRQTIRVVYQGSCHYDALIV